MPGRNDKIYEEAAALWQQLYGEPPPASADGSAILSQILSGLPDADYDRIADPNLRRSQIVFPKY